jgi:hypothetical protein
MASADGSSQHSRSWFADLAGKTTEEWRASCGDTAQMLLTLLWRCWLHYTTRLAPNSTASTRTRLQSDTKHWGIIQSNMTSCFPLRCIHLHDSTLQQSAALSLPSVPCDSTMPSRANQRNKRAKNKQQTDTKSTNKQTNKQANKQTKRLTKNWGAKHSHPRRKWVRKKTDWEQTSQHSKHCRNCKAICLPTYLLAYVTYIYVT